MRRPVAIIDATLLTRLPDLQEIEPLLPLLYSQILIPRSVRDEIGRAGQGRRRLRNLMAESAGFYVDCTAGDPFSIDLYAVELDSGEAEALAQAQELSELSNADVHVLMDEDRGVEIAKSLGLGVVRTGRLLLELKRLEAIELVGPLLKKLVALGFHLSAEVAQVILREAGEADE